MVRYYLHLFLDSQLRLITTDEAALSDRIMTYKFDLVDSCKDFCLYNISINGIFHFHDTVDIVDNLVHSHKTTKNVFNFNCNTDTFHGIVSYLKEQNAKFEVKTATVY
jgi:hypothetical protein